MADLNKDNFFDKKFENKEESNDALQFLRGQLDTIEDLIGLPEILKKYKPIEKN